MVEVSRVKLSSISARFCGIAVGGTHFPGAVETSLGDIIMRKILGPLAISSALGLTASLSLGATTPASLTVGASFAGGAYGANGTAGSANYVKDQSYPPDMAGAVGGTSGASYAVQLINGYYGIWSLNTSGSTTTPTLVSQSSDATFWASAGINITPSNMPFDPRLQYDSNSQRWFAVQDSFSASGYANNIMLAVSKTSNPTQGWTGYSIPGSLPNPSGGGGTGPGSWQGTTYGGGTGTWGGTAGSNGSWQGTVANSSAQTQLPSASPNPKASSGSGYFADFPTLGVTPGYVTIGANLYPVSGGNMSNTPTGISVISIPKAALLAATPSTTGMTTSYNLSPNTYGYTPNPVNDMSTTTPPGTAYIASSGYAGIQQSTITTVNNAPIVSASTYTAFNEVGKTVPQMGQPGTTHTLDGGDFRLSSNLNLVNINGTPLIWGVQTIANPTNASLSALRVFAIAAGNNKPIVDQIFTDAANPTNSLAYGSLAINSSGQLVLSFNESGTGNGQYISIKAVAGTFDTSNNTITFGTVQTLKASTTDYYLVDNLNRNRWGDYSATVVDPNHAGVFYSFAEYATGTASWGTQITQLSFVPGTATGSPTFTALEVPEPVSLSLLCLGGLPLLLRRRQTR